MEPWNLYIAMSKAKNALFSFFRVLGTRFKCAQNVVVYRIFRLTICVLVMLMLNFMSNCFMVLSVYHSFYNFIWKINIYKEQSIN